MKSLQAPNLKTIAFTKVMYTVIHSYYEQAFDNMNEESEKKALLFRNRCGLFQVKLSLSRPKNMGVSDPSEVTQETPEDPRQRGGRGSPDEGYN